MGTSIQKRYEYFLSLIRQAKFSTNEILQITHAFKYADSLHHNQFRKSGDPFIIHPLETAITLAEWKMDSQTIVAGLLHDVIEDTDTSPEKIKDFFGDQVTKLVSYVTKISNYSQERRRNAVDINRDTNYLRQIYLSLAEDTRAIIIKLADRLHNMRTIEHVKPDRKISISKETLEIYSELAGRLGMVEVKSQLQDLAFGVINKEAFLEIERQAKPLYSKGEKSMKQIISTVKKGLQLHNIKNSIKYRKKSIYSIYKKVSSGSVIKEIKDIVALRIIVDSIQECYTVLGMIHVNFQILDNSFKDYIANPKVNLYQSLHTTIIFNDSQYEVQIRTKRMDELADFGIAAHWRYKDHDASYTTNIATEIKSIIDADPKTGLQRIKKEILAASIIVFVKGVTESINMPNGSTILDLAFKVMPKKAFYLIDARQNGERVLITNKLINNSEIEFNYGSKEKINEKWQNYVVTIPAVEMIKAKLQKIKSNRNAFEFNQWSNNLKDSENKKLIYERIRDLGFKNINEFMEFADKYKIAFYLINKFYIKDNEVFRDIRSQLLPKIRSWFQSKEYVRPTNLNVVYSGTIITKCCTKLPGDNIVGIIQNDKLMVHSINCQNIVNKKFIELEWNKDKLKELPRMFRANLFVEATWNETVTNEIAKTIINNAANINNIHIKRNKLVNKFTVIIVFYTENRNKVETILEKIALIPQVVQVKRLN